MTSIERKILEFIIDGKVYSKVALQKHFGITEDELELIYKNLLDEGYLETYAEFKAREIKNDIHHDSCGCGNGCGSCSSNKESGCGGCHSHSDDISDDKDEDDDEEFYKDALVLTPKAIEVCG